MSEGSPKAGSEATREENLSIKEIGRSEPEAALRNIYEIPLLPLLGGRKVSVEAFLIGEISNIRNEHIDEVTKHYPHLQNLVFFRLLKT